MPKIKDVGEDNLCDLPYSMHAFYGRHGGGLLLGLIYIDKILENLLIGYRRYENCVIIDMI